MADPDAQVPAGAAVLLTGDLIFSTKITGTARALGLDVHVVASPELAAQQAGGERVRCVLLDLGLAGLGPDSIRAIVTAAAGRPVLAFGSHVDVAQLAAAQQAGCVEVMPRSRLAATLPQLLERYLRG